MTNITIANNLLKIGISSYNADDCIAQVKNSDTVVIVNRNEPKDGLFENVVSKLKLNDVAYANADLFCIAFNALAGGKTADETLHIREEASDIRANTDYPNRFVSSHTVIGGVKAKAANIQKPGYLEIEADDLNAGIVYVGEVDVTAASRNLKAGKKAVVEIDDLSKIYILASQADQVVEISGGYKE